MITVQLPPDTSFYATMAGIAATLIALSYLSMTFSLEKLLSRFDSLALPVYLDEYARNHRRPLLLRASKTLESRQLGNVDDRTLFESDPLYVFMAFSVNVTNILYFTSLALSLTVLVVGLQPLILAIELAILASILAASIVRRSRAYGHLQTYRLREERFWAVMYAATLILYGVGIYSSISEAFPSVAQHVGLIGVQVVYAVVVKLVGCSTIVFALYFIITDLYVFFKAAATYDMRCRWLARFVESYGTLAGQVDEAISWNSSLRRVWNDGYPPASAMINPPVQSPEEAKTRWDQLMLGTRTVAPWMIDVPAIAIWEREVRFALSNAGAL